MLLGQKLPKPSKPLLIDVAGLFAILLLYYAIRFWTGSSIAFPILLAFVFCIRKSIGVNIFRLFDFRLLSVFLLLIAASIPTTFAQNNSVAANYFIFLFVIFWCKATGQVWLTRLDHKRVQLLVSAYIFYALPFLLLPSLQQYSTKPAVLVDVIALGYVTEDTHGLLAFFYHSGEFGIVTAGLAALLSVSAFHKNGCFKAISIDMLLYLILFTFILVSRSTTGKIISVASLALTLKHGKYVGYGLWFVLLAQCLTQIFFIDNAINNTVGSFQWRYQMAKSVLSVTEMLRFSPDSINTLSSWPHSLLLDILLCYGKVVGVLFATALLVIPLLKERRSYMGWHALFFCACLVMPIGAGPSLYPAALACAYAENVFSKKRNEP